MSPLCPWVKAGACNGNQLVFNRAFRKKNSALMVEKECILNRQQYSRRKRDDVAPALNIVLLLLLSFLVYRGVQNGSMKFTVKKLVLGLLLTIVAINVIMIFII